MKTAEPIRNAEQLLSFKEYYKTIKPVPRNYLLITLGLNTALRISDILDLRWKDVFDESTSTYRKHIFLVEKKTGKYSRIYMNESICEALNLYRESKWCYQSEWLFWSQGNREVHISRMQAHRIVKEAASYCNIEGIISCHSLRKSFGYYAWKSGISPVMLMNIYNHSSYQVTKRYLGIEQEDRDQVFQTILL